MNFLLQAIIAIDDLIKDLLRLADNVRWYVYFFIVIIVMILLLIRPFVRARKKESLMEKLLEEIVHEEEIDKKIFIRLNRKNLAKDEVEKVIKNIIKYAEIKNDMELLNTITHLSSRYQKEKDILNKGLKNFTDNIEYNRIKYSLLQIISSISE